MIDSSRRSGSITKINLLYKICLKKLRLLSSYYYLCKDNKNKNKGNC